jgi:hypothetical protein
MGWSNMGRAARSGCGVGGPARWLTATLVIATISVGALATPGPGVSAQAGDGTATDDATRELAERYAPLFRLKEQRSDCDTDGEAFMPTSVEIVLDNPDVVLRQLGNGNPVIMNAPGAADLFDRGGGLYLDVPGDALQPDCLYERDAARYNPARQSTVYAHVARQEGHPDQLALQYWTYWYYNDWNNKHEGDWEGIQLLFDASDVDEALAAEPVSVGYAQHEGGERAGWNDSKLERVGDRPVVYSSAGSHASYFGSALYIGRGPSTGFGCDNTDGPSIEVDPSVVVLPDRVDDATDPLSWLEFEGRWASANRGRSTDRRALPTRIAGPNRSTGTTVCVPPVWSFRAETRRRIR